ncbi:MAG: sigma-70 family RNA polymerase sigma factor [Anaerolineae bacterium]|nr:sigma-70 family RNA polymerase sigma factor [Anaerolineae bacterium]MDQ7036455.1 sigma-70 family RNA polymerase sigma factor [Anaerolineae bacterium]
MLGFNRKPKKPNYKDLSDIELVVYAKEDKEAFGEIYERYLDKIYNYIYYRTGNQQDAEDLTAKVFYRAMSHIENYVDKGVPFQAWLYRIAHNLVANFHRDKGRRKIIPLDDYIAHTLHSDAPDKQAESSEQEALLMEAIRRLPADRQQLIILKFIEQKSNQDIGEVMGRTEGAIKSLYHRTLLSLRDELQLQQMNIGQADKRKTEGKG